MKASDAVVLAFAACCSVCACAEGYGAPEIGRLDSAALAPTMGGMKSAAPLGGAAAEVSAGGTGGVAMPAGEPCTQGDVKACSCEGTEAQGQQTCLFDMASPEDGFFSECMNCPPPRPVGPDPTLLCSDGMRNGAETSSDCGGPDCMPCALGSACLVDTDCAEGTCVVGMCAAPATGGEGGTGGSSGAGGSGGEGEPPREGPVEDCEGVPEGTACDRDCILPSNTARCTSRGTCSCLG